MFGVGAEVVLLFAIVIPTITTLVGVCCCYRWWNKRNRPVRARPSSSASPSSSGSNANLPPNSDDDVCPICLDTIKFAIETNCGHSFCANCFLTCWRTTNANTGIRCPYCRRYVSVLIPNWPISDFQTHRDELSAVTNGIRDYTRRASSTAQGFWQTFANCPVLLRWLIRRGTSGGWPFIRSFVDNALLVQLTLAIVYLVAPVDLIPEALFGIFGLLDDLAVWGGVAVYVAHRFHQWLVQEAARQQ